MIDKEQEQFLNELSIVQRATIDINIENEAQEKLLTEITYETIIKIMELIDGENIDCLKLELLDVEKGKSLSNNISLSHLAADFLKK